jgi:hypothetical protein
MIGLPRNRCLLQRISPLLALNGHAGSHQICPLLKVDRTCHRVAVTSHIDPLLPFGNRFCCDAQQRSRATVWYNRA